MQVNRLKIIILLLISSFIGGFLVRNTALTVFRLLERSEVYMVAYYMGSVSNCLLDV